jgi:hypothetical protein
VSEGYELINIEGMNKEEKVDKKVIDKISKIRKLLQYLEGVKVPWYKVPDFLRKETKELCGLKILSPVVSTRIDCGEEKKKYLEYLITSSLFDGDLVGSCLAIYEVDPNETEEERKKQEELNLKALKNAKEILKFLKRTKGWKFWSDFTSSPVSLTVLGAVVGIGFEKLLGAIIDSFSNNIEIILHIIK